MFWSCLINCYHLFCLLAHGKEKYCGQGGISWFFMISNKFFYNFSLIPLQFGFIYLWAILLLSISLVLCSLHMYCTILNFRYYNFLLSIKKISKDSKLPTVEQRERRGYYSVYISSWVHQVRIWKVIWFAWKSVFLSAHNTLSILKMSKDTRKTLVLI